MGATSITDTIPPQKIDRVSGTTALVEQKGQLGQSKYRPSRNLEAHWSLTAPAKLEPVLRRPCHTRCRHRWWTPRNSPGNSRSRTLFHVERYQLQENHGRSSDNRIVEHRKCNAPPGVVSKSRDEWPVCFHFQALL